MDLSEVIGSKGMTIPSYQNFVVGINIIYFFLDK
jgi:hypothetical protein